MTKDFIIANFRTILQVLGGILIARGVINASDWGSFADNTVNLLGSAIEVYAVAHMWWDNWNTVKVSAK